MKMDNFILKVAVLCVLFGISVKGAPNKPIVYAIEDPKLVVEASSEQKDKHCLAVMIYGEAKGENFYGKSAVAWTAINRYDRMPYNSICSVVLARNQYHAFNRHTYVVAAIKGSPPANDESWEESKKVAELAYNGVLPDPTKGSTHFVNPKKLKFKPKWLSKLKLKAIIESHTFYG
jgi:spore germination cell wall hydrolase CwlJ-like protein